MIEPLAFFKCLAEETRLKSLLLISEKNELCVCELTYALELSQPKVSRHLAELRKCGLLSDQRRGKWVYYRVNNALPSWASQVLALTVAENPQFMQKLLQRLEHMQNRPQSRCSDADNYCNEEHKEPA
ncbi:metalloregulator ArsR/SmtB family transcription factor [Lacimicrobium alkaliphilum]|uniref:Transcriptional regulator n=1 Tax=Lacimicrobium alkaliphilum TaxID=1526571 RepID=A0ABQ1RG76_9ALTE|nr:metalloregulator ArsR/SmtB family transcription factor [Lacimicrobium alkaliphilum]GGD65630.1 transcriptional regulator [Lacimicrobium alkaliphilum]